MPFSSGRSVRAPASNATRTVIARVPGRSIRCIGRPLGSVVLSIFAMLPRYRCGGSPHAERGAGLAAALEVEDVVAVHEDRVPARIDDLAEAVRPDGVRAEPVGDLLERPLGLQVAAVEQLDPDADVVLWHGSPLQGLVHWRVSFTG